jgi:hypothetical protein
MNERARDNNKKRMPGRELQRQESSSNRVAADYDDATVFSYSREYRSKNQLQHNLSQEISGGNDEGETVKKNAAV